MKRRPDESFEDYQKRRKEEQNSDKTKLKGKLFCVGKILVEKEGKKTILRPENFQGTIRRIRKEDKPNG